MIFYDKKNHHIGNILVKCNSNNGVFDTVNDISRNRNETTFNIHNKISSHQQLTRNKVFMLYHQNVGGLRKQINELIMSFYIHTPHILCFSEHYLKHTQRNFIFIEKYILGAEYCRQFFDGCGASIFTHKASKFLTINLHEFCKDNDLEVCIIPLELPYINGFVITVHISPSGDFQLFVNFNIF
jgi:hypothetical protein